MKSSAKSYVSRCCDKCMLDQCNWIMKIDFYDFIFHAENRDEHGLLKPQWIKDTKNDSRVGVGDRWTKNAIQRSVLAPLTIATVDC